MDDEPIELDVTISAGDDALKYLRQMAKDAKALQAPIDNASGAVQKLDAKMKLASGPADRLAKAYQNLAKANSGSNPVSQFDAQHNYNRAQKTFNKAQRGLNPQAPSFFDKLKGVITSSRFGAGGLMPLVGKTLDLLGVEAVAAAAAVKLLWDAAVNAAQSLTEFRQSMLTSGGSASETGRLGTIGRITGVDDPAGLSRSLSDALKDNGAGSAAGSRLNIKDYGNGLSGPTDKAANLLRVLDTIGDRNVIKSDQEAIRLARALHVEQVLIYRDVSDTTKEMGRQAALASTVAHGQGAGKDAAEFNAQMGIMSTWFDTLATGIGSSFLPQATGAVELFGDIAHGLHNIYTFAKPLIDLTNNLSPLALYKRLHDAAAAADAQLNKDATDRNTEALNKNTDAALKQGTYGGGANARGAVPAAWGGANSRNWDGQARALGSML